MTRRYPPSHQQKAFLGPGGLVSSWDRPVRCGGWVSKTSCPGKCGAKPWRTVVVLFGCRKEMAIPGCSGVGFFAIYFPQRGGGHLSLVSAFAIGFEAPLLGGSTGPYQTTKPLGGKLRGQRPSLRSVALDLVEGLTIPTSKEILGGRTWMKLGFRPRCPFSPFFWGRAPLLK